MRVPIITDEAAQEGGWHGIALSQAFKKRGVETVFVELQDCLIDLSGEEARIVIPHFEVVPQIAFVRGIAAGTLQQVITRLNILHTLSMMGCYVYNNAKSIERTVDKGMTSFLLKKQGISTPPTWICESRHLAHDLIKTQAALGRHVIAKPLFGSQGKGVRVLDNMLKLPLPGDMFVDGVYYLQTMIDTGKNNYDYRVFVINNQAVLAMRRSGDGWLHNVAKGARCQIVDEEDVLSLGVQAAKALQIDYCGVDIIRDQHGLLWVIEVNSIPAWSGLQSVSDKNVAQLLVDDLLSKLND